MNRIKSNLIFIFISLVFSLPQNDSILLMPGRSLVVEPFFDSAEYQTLDEVFKVSLNYFLSPEVITISGLPLTALKVGDRARYGYSNPTEWGYAIQAWIAGAERGVISHEEALEEIRIALNTMQNLQQDPLQNFNGLFYPYYKVTDAEGNDVVMPYQDGDARIPSGDNALLYASLLITEGWARNYCDDDIANLAKEIKDRMRFQMFLFEINGKKYLSHQINAITGQLSDNSWAIFADEGNVVAWVAYFSNSISFDDYQDLTEAQSRTSALWTSCNGEIFSAREAALYNAMFTWGIRSLAGFPTGSFDVPAGTQSKYNLESFVPSVAAHLAYGDCLHVDYPAFSDAMTQTAGNLPLVGTYTPPNIEDKAPIDPPEHVVPYALFVPFNAGAELGIDTKEILITKIIQLIGDKAGYYHFSGDYPFGFEVLASPYKDDLDYTGADEGRNIFETLSESYTVLSLFNGLQLNDHNPTFYWYAEKVPGYVEEMQKVLNYLYPFQNYSCYLPVLYKTSSLQPGCDLGIYRFASNGVYPEERSIRIDKSCFVIGKNKIMLENSNLPQSNHWLVWDSLNLRDGYGSIIWELGKNEAPPKYDSTAFDEFDNQPPYLSNFYVGLNTTGDFPKEINDLSLDHIYIYFNLTGEEQGNSFTLFLDTLYATHDQVPYYDLHLKISPED